MLYEEFILKRVLTLKQANSIIHTFRIIFPLTRKYRWFFIYIKFIAQFSKSCLNYSLSFHSSKRINNYTSTCQSWILQYSLVPRMTYGWQNVTKCVNNCNNISWLELVTCLKQTFHSPFHHTTLNSWEKIHINLNWNS